MRHDVASAERDRASLEAAIESGILRLDSLHPGGIATTLELIEACGVSAGSRVLDVASGSGETACVLAERFGARVDGVDHSEEMIRTARDKARVRGFDVTFQAADAGSLPFEDGVFDVAICECALCLLDKARVLAEMTRVVRPGGRVGMHDLCWHDDAPERLKSDLAELEDERPETLAGWERLFAEAGLVRIRTLDLSSVKAGWMRDSTRQLGVTGLLRVGARIVRRWGIAGLWTILRSQRVFADRRLGYGIVIGTRR